MNGGIGIRRGGGGRKQGDEGMEIIKWSDGAQSPFESRQNQKLHPLYRPRLENVGALEFLEI